MAWQTLKVLKHPWKSGSKQILIGGFQKGKTYLFTKGAQKLEDVKFGSPLKVYSYAVNQTIQTLTDCNFGAPWGTKTFLTFLKTSNQY